MLFLEYYYQQKNDSLSIMFYLFFMKKIPVFLY